MNQGGKKVSIRDLAAHLGLSKSTVSYALRSHPGVNRKTRDRVIRAAKRLGYAPDARLSAWMGKVSQANDKGLLPMAWLTTTWRESSWRDYSYLSPYIEGAQERALAHGYHLEEIWTRQPGLSNRRISQILRAKGIGGVIVSYPASHLRLQWDHFAAVSLGARIIRPSLHSVSLDPVTNLLTAIRTVRKAGYRRIGICLPVQIDHFSFHTLRALVHYHATTTRPKVFVSPLFYRSDPMRVWIRNINAWLRRVKPDVVICLTSEMEACVQTVGWKVPEEVGVVHIATDDDVTDWAGIDARKREVGATAVDIVLSQVQRSDFGPPGDVRRTVVQGVWHGGRTLLVPKPGAAA